MGLSTGKIAAPRVFAVPELLEAILVYVSWTDLFVLQRVNKTFFQVIAGSKNLKRAMELHMLTMPRYVNGGSPLLQEISWASLNFEFFPTNAITTRGTNLTIKLIYDVWLLSSSSLQKSFGTVGVGKQKRLFYNVNSRGTWRVLRLTSLPGIVWIHINVVIHATPKYASGLAYRDLVALSAENATFGDMADMLWEMEHRLPEEHLKLCRASSRHAKLRELTDAKCIRGDSRERVTAVVAWNGEEPDPAMIFINSHRESERLKKEKRMADLEDKLERDFSGQW